MFAFTILKSTNSLCSISKTVALAAILLFGISTAQVHAEGDGSGQGNGGEANGEAASDQDCKGEGCGKGKNTSKTASKDKAAKEAVAAVSAAVARAGLGPKATEKGVQVAGGFGKPGTIQSITTYNGSVTTKATGPLVDISREVRDLSGAIRGTTVKSYDDFGRNLTDHKTNLK